MEFFSSKGPDLDIVEPGDAAFVGIMVEFCLLKVGKLRRALKGVVERQKSLGVKQGEPVLSDMARLVGGTRTEAVLVLNQDQSLVQPIMSGANCF